MALKLYANYLSQPSRAVLFFLLENSIPFEFKNVDMAKQEQRKEEFLKINPNGLVPVIVEDDGFALYESHAILSYLAGKYNVPEHWLGI